jgi:hypothetical protein
VDSSVFILIEFIFKVLNVWHSLRLSAKVYAYFNTIWEKNQVFFLKNFNFNTKFINSVQESAKLFSFFREKGKFWAERHIYEVEFERNVCFYQSFFRKDFL